jgi:hypothetical protein
VSNPARPADGGLMRNPLKVRAASVRMAALKAGYRRLPEGDRPAENVIAWLGPAGEMDFTGDPEPMPAPLRFAVRALVIAWFAGECRLCGARAQTLTVDEMENVDLDRWQVVTGHRVQDGGLGAGTADPEHFAIEHAAACACAPGQIYRMADAGSN